MELIKFILILGRFVAALTDPRYDDFGGSLHSAFLSFYRCVVSARVVLLLLRERYQVRFLLFKMQKKNLNFFVFNFLKNNNNSITN